MTHSALRILTCKDLPITVSTPQKKLFLLDGMALIYRAHFAFIQTPITTAKGISSGAILGFTNTLVEVLHKENPTHIMVAFDAKEKTFRHDLFPAYKAHRPTQPVAISMAIPYIQSILDGFGIVHISCKGYEADDILGTVAQQASTMGFTTYIMSADKDLAQIVGANIYLYRPSKQGQKAVILGEKEILAEWKITTPSQVKDILALVGDATDAIPGIPSIGKKTAQKLIQQYGSLEHIFANSDQLTGKLKANLIQYQAQGHLSKQLATICTDVPISLNLHNCRYQGPNRGQLAPLLQELEFKQLQKRLWPPDVPLLDPNGRTIPPTNIALARLQQNPNGYTLVQTLPAAQALFQKLEQTSKWAFHILATGKDPHAADLLGIAFSSQSGTAHYLSIPPDPHAAQRFFQCMQPLLLRPDIAKAGHNLKYDLIVLQRHGLRVAPPLFDIMIAHALLQPDRPNHLTALSENHLGHTPTPIEPLIGPNGKSQRPIQTVAIDHVRTYASEKADIIFQIYQKLSRALDQESLADLFHQLEMPLLQVLVEMERTGVTIDLPFLDALGTDMQSAIQLLQETIYTLADRTFNIHSPKQLGAVLFTQLKLKAKPIKTKNGQYATREAVLESLLHTHPIVAAIKEYRSLEKLRATYVEALPTMVHPTDQRIHTSYQQAVVITGRLSSIAPNLQNIPIRTAQGRKLRQAFIPHHPGDYLLSADYSQIELRIMAAYAQDPTLMKAFQENQDIHTITASKLFKVPLANVNAAMRSQAKIANFGIIYGISPFGLAQRMGHLSTKEAAALMNDYFREFPGIKQYMERTIAEAESNGYVTTLLGRKRLLPDIHAGNALARNAAQRNAINTPIQGSAAEMIKLAMIQIQHWLQANQMQSKIILQVHDELVFNVPASEIADLQKNIPLLMAQSLPLKGVPIQVNCGIGPNWLSAH